MSRRMLGAAMILAASCGSALAEPPGRFQIVTAPLGLEGEGEASAVLLDTQTGRSWHAIVDDRGRPRWRGIEFAGGAQGHAQAPEPLAAAAADDAAAEAASDGAAGEAASNSAPGEAASSGAPPAQ
jgi:hypothetical protein